MVINKYSIRVPTAFTTDPKTGLMIGTSPFTSEPYRDHKCFQQMDEYFVSKETEDKVALLAKEVKSGKLSWTEYYEKLRSLL